MRELLPYLMILLGGYFAYIAMERRLEEIEGWGLYAFAGTILFISGIVLA